MSTKTPSPNSGAMPTSAGLITGARSLSNPELIARVKALAGEEQQVTTVLIAHLSVLDERQLYLAEGCPSLFTYLTQVLHFSEHAAYGRIQAARAARRHPIILDLLSTGAVNLTTITLLAPELTTRNHHELLMAARFKSRRQVEELVARLRPLAPVRPSVRKLPDLPAGPSSPTAWPADLEQSPTAPPSSRENGGAVESQIAATLGLDHLPTDSTSSGGPASPARRGLVTPLAPQSYRVQFTATAEMHAKMRAAQELLRHVIPDGDLAKVLDHALTALLVDLTKQKFGVSARARNTARDKRGIGNGRGQDGSRYIPTDVRRAVWIRDGGCCAFTGRDGRRCTERGFLEFHHVVPYSAGGKASVDNIQLRCRAHNRYEADADPNPGSPEIDAESMSTAPPSTPPPGDGRGQAARPRSTGPPAPR